MYHILMTISLLDRQCIIYWWKLLIWKESFTNEGQYFHQYQQSERKKSPEWHYLTDKYTLVSISCGHCLNKLHSVLIAMSFLVRYIKLLWPCFRFVDIACITFSPINFKSSDFTVATMTCITVTLYICRKSNDHRYACRNHKPFLS